MKFTDEEIEFMKSSGLNFDFNNLSEDEWIAIEDRVGDELTLKGLDLDYYPNKTGKMCYRILDKLND